MLRWVERERTLQAIDLNDLDLQQIRCPRFRAGRTGGNRYQIPFLHQAALNIFMMGFDENNRCSSQAG